MVVYEEGSTVSLDLMKPCEAGGHRTAATPQVSTQGLKCIDPNVTTVARQRIKP